MTTDVVFNNPSNDADGRLVAVDDASRSAQIGRWFFQTGADIFAGTDTAKEGAIDQSAPILGIDRYGNIYTQGRTGTDTAKAAASASDAGLVLSPLVILAGLAFLLLRK